MVGIGQFLPFILAPPLHHHQQVEMTAVLLIVTLKIVGRIGYKAFQLAGKQQIGHHIAIVVGRPFGTRVADSQRESGLRWQLQTDTD